MSLINYINNNKLRFTSKEKNELGKAKAIKYNDNGKIKFAVHEQPALIITSSIKEAIKKYYMLKGK